MQKLKLDYTHNNSVVQITLNAPKGNVLDQIMMGELLEVFAQLKSNQNIKLIAFTGEGDHFSFGASVEEHKKENAAAMLKGFHQLFYDLIDLSIPTFAQVSGMCLGGGCELALMCNFIFAEESAKFGQPEIMLGVIPPPASLLLPLKIGNAKAEELLITGKNISAQDAKMMGLVNEVCADKDTLQEEIDKFVAKHILPKSASSLRFAVKAARMEFNEVILKKLPQMEKLYLEELMETSDANEGIQAFLDKRKAEWVNG